MILIMYHKTRLKGNVELHMTRRVVFDIIILKKPLNTSFKYGISIDINAIRNKKPKISEICTTTTFKFQFCPSNRKNSYFYIYFNVCKYYLNYRLK